jgi:hypothetical protein
MSEPVLAEAIGTIDGVNRDFNAPSAYWPGTLFAYLNGVLIRSVDVNGPIEKGGTDVEMKEAPLTGDTLHFYYQSQPPVDGGFIQPPTMLSALQLVPVMRGSVDLRPRMVSSEEEVTEDEPPEMLSAKNLKPEMRGSVDLRPRMISAEEV